VKSRFKDIFGKFGEISIAVLGDYCLDEYLWIDAELNEPSLETGLVAYQCVKRETYPGAAGTIAKNLANLGIGEVYAIGYVGGDGRGLELCRGLDILGVNCEGLVTANDRVTPTYTKPWIKENGQQREMSRIDSKNWTPTPPELEEAVIAQLDKILNRIDALIIMDQMTEENCGIITDSVRQWLTKTAAENPELILYADSRSRIGLFDGVMIKGNQYEIANAVYGEGHHQPAAGLSVPQAEDLAEIDRACEQLRQKNGCPVVCTLGAKGVRIYTDSVINVPALEVAGQTDVCGAGDMFTSAFVSALTAGAGMEQASVIGNIAAAICVGQLGTSGNVNTTDILQMEFGNDILQYK